MYPDYAFIHSTSILDLFAGKSHCKWFRVSEHVGYHRANVAAWRRRIRWTCGFGRTQVGKWHHSQYDLFPSGWRIEESWFVNMLFFSNQCSTGCWLWTYRVKQSDEQYPTLVSGYGRTRTYRIYIEHDVFICMYKIWPVYPHSLGAIWSSWPPGCATVLGATEAFGLDESWCGWDPTDLLRRYQTKTSFVAFFKRKPTDFHSYASSLEGGSSLDMTDFYWRALRPSLFFFGGLKRPWSTPAKYNDNVSTWRCPKNAHHFPHQKCQKFVEAGVQIANFWVTPCRGPAPPVFAWGCSLRSRACAAPTKTHTKKKADVWNQWC